MIGRKRNKNKKLAKVFDVEKNFIRPYTFTRCGINEIHLCADLGGSQYNYRMMKYLWKSLPGSRLL